MTKKQTILVTGAGGAAIPFIVRTLKDHGYRVLTADMDPYAAGLFLGDGGWVIPKADDEHFFRAIQDICKKESVDVIIPLVDEELVAVADIEYNGVIPLTPNVSFIKTCLDKYQLIQKLQECQIPVPKTCLAGDGDRDIRYPCIVKPRTGRGSRGVELLQSSDDYARWIHRSGIIPDDYILQEYISGTEYTVSVVVWRDGSVQAVVPKEIISKRGVTRLAVTKHHKGIEEYCKNIQNYLRADGPFNVQLRLDEKTHTPLLFEINPRYSTTVSLTIMAGIDELHGLIQQALHGSQAYVFGEWKEGVILMRYNQDIPMSYEEFTLFSGNIRKAP